MQFPRTASAPRFWREEQNEDSEGNIRIQGEWEEEMMWKLNTDKVRVGSEVIWLTGHPNLLELACKV